MAIAISEISNLGIVDFFEQIVDNNFFDLTIPFLQSASATYSLNTTTKRILTVSGHVDGTTTVLNNFVTDVNSWVNVTGTQADATLTDAFGNTFTVICNRFQYSIDSNQSGIPNRLNYVLELKEVANSF